MTTSASPLSALKRQADQIADLLKRGVGGKLPNFPKKDRVKFGVVMDDKVITVEMDWTTICETDQRALSEMIVREMQGRKADA